MDKTARMKELIPLLNEAAKAYYQEDREIMSNFDYDKLYDELVLLERETGITLTGSPTAMVGYEALDELQKEAHESPMLSLDKTKDVETLREFIGDQKTLLSWKLDGLTIVLTYRDGSLSKAVTRGNGVVGEVITNNAMVFKNIPLQIAHKGELILRGRPLSPILTLKRSTNRSRMWMPVTKIPGTFAAVPCASSTTRSQQNGMCSFTHSPWSGQRAWILRTPGRNNLNGWQARDLMWWNTGW